MGHELQKQQRKVRRPAAHKILTGDPDDSLTGVAGLVGFAGFTNGIGLEREIAERFGHMKSGPNVVYPMGSQLRLLLDAIVADEERVFGLRTSTRSLDCAIARHPRGPRAAPAT